MSDSSNKTSELDHEQLKSSYERVLDSSNTVIIRGNPEFSVTEVIGNSEKVFGIAPERLIQMGSYLWARVVHREDRQRLINKMSNVFQQPREFAEEFRIIHPITGKIRCILGRGVPLFDRNEKLTGWEGIAVDITEIRSTEEELVSERRRIGALYEVARSLQMNLDPAMVALKGIRALITATDSHSGLVFSYDERGDTLELMAAEGVTKRYIEEVEKLVNGPSLVRFAISQQEGILVDNIQNDPRAVVKVAKIEGLKATIVAPLIIGKRVLGAVVVFRKESRKYTEADFELVTAAANQIAIATRQAELFANEKKQADLFSALYRLSHELSGQLTPKEISNHAFKILHQQLACKRMWLGVINEQGSHIIGQAGFGPGVRKRIIEMQLELSNDPNNLLAIAINQKQPMVVDYRNLPGCTELERVFEKLNPAPFAIVPLISLGQLVGVLAIEPSAGVGFFNPSRLSFLTSMANEIAVVLMANRFQVKMAEADKMRMAGLFASGVAHNFNNMLQAIIGQASLMEMQLDPKSNIHDAIEIIKSAAGRGAGLIKQLLSFSSLDTRARSNLSVNDLFDQSKDLYRTILGSGIDLEINLTKDILHVFADQGQLQQVLTNLLVNAKESIPTNDGKVMIVCDKVHLRSGEIDPELSPGEYVRIEIIDTGIGMEEEVLKRCFEPFYTTKNVDSITGIGISGSGLGLSTAYSILKQHDGIITAQSFPGEGSTFSIYLPLVKQSEVRQTLPQPKVMLYALDPVQQLSLNSILNALNLTPIHYRRQNDLNAFIDDLATTKLLILDADRTADSLVDLVEFISKSKDNIRVIILTFSGDKWRSLLSEYNFVEIHEKPVGVWAFKELIKRNLNSYLKPGLRSEIDSVVTELTGNSYHLGGVKAPEERINDFKLKPLK